METGTVKLPDHLNARLKDLQNGEPHRSLLTAKPANVWLGEAALRPVPKKLFGEFWYEDEVCILFSDSNLGKSILAVQIAESIARSRPLAWFEIETAPQRVLLCDFELSDMQFTIRYSEREGDFCTNLYEFSPNLFRAEINPFQELPAAFSSFEDYIVYSLEQSIVEYEINVVIVDNITYLKNETEKAKEAIGLMKHLQTLAARLKVSLLALAHTPKRDGSRPITMNDLGGSRHLANFCDSIFAVGKSQKDEHLRYLKQIKIRNGEFCYGESNVAISQISKHENYLGFEFLEFANELEHLKKLTGRERGDLEDRIRHLHHQGFSLREIEGMIGGVSYSTVRRIIKSA